MTQSSDIPTTQRFLRFERVSVNRFEQGGSQVNDASGTVIWADPPQKTSGQSEWVYCVHLNAHRRYLNILESNLRGTGTFDAPNAHMGMTFEISHDLLPDESRNFAFVEGTYRLPGKFWEVMIFTKSEVPVLHHRVMTWESGISGVAFDVPLETLLHKSFVEQAMSNAFDVDRWVEVKGPDSMILR